MKGRNSKKFVYTFLVIVCAAGMYKLKGVIFTPSRCSFSFDSELSPTTKQAIKDAVKSSYLGPLAAIPHAIQKVCPAAGDINVQLTPDKTVHVRINKSNPYLRIAEDTVLLRSGKLVKADYFYKEVVEQLPHISIAQQGEISDQCKSWLLHLDPSLVQEYTICLHDDYEIVMADKIDQHKKIICSVFTPINDEIKGMCQRIIDERLRSMQGTARSVCYSADIRFEKQIIVCSQKGGACHG